MHRAKFLSRSAAVVGVLLLVSQALAVGQFSIQLTAGPELQKPENADALAAFNQAAAQWQGVISSPVRVNIYVDIAPLGLDGPPAVTGLGASNLAMAYAGTGGVREAMVARAGQPGNAILSNLPLNLLATVPANGAIDTAMVSVTRANQKALGLILDPESRLSDTENDGNIFVNTSPPLTVTRSGGSVAAGTYDLQTIVAREIGAILGFQSAVDQFDAIPDETYRMTVMDLFRFAKTAAPTNGSQFSTAARQLNPGAPAVFADTASTWELSTGETTGDGFPAARWKDDALSNEARIGIMDPTLPTGVSWDIGATDLRVIELIGWNTTVPEPGTIGLLALGTLAILGRRRRSV